MVRLRSPECKGKVRFLGKGSCEQICHRTMLGEIASVQIVRACIVMLYDPRSYGFERSQLETSFSSRLRVTLSVIRGNSAKQFPHFSERWMGLCQFRVRELDLNVVKRSVHILDLSDRVPTFVPLFPAVTIR